MWTLVTLSCYLYASKWGLFGTYNSTQRIGTKYKHSGHDKW